MTVTRGRTPWSLLGVIGALTALVIAAHGGALRGTFHYDDLFAVGNNPAVRSWDPVRIALSTEAVNSERNASGYRPLTVGSLALNYRLSGPDASGYLATNLLLHVLASALVVLLARELLGDLRWAAAAGAVFALHPVNAEAVNYVTARSSLLSTVFALAAAWAFVRDAEGRAGVGGRAAGLVAFLCALLSKESAVALAAPVLVYPWLFRRRPSDAKAFSRGVRAAAGYGVVAAGFVAGFGWLTAGGTTVLVPGQRPAWTFLEMVGRSMALWVWPWPLGLDHPLTFLSRFDAVLAAALLIGAAGFVAAVLWLRARAPAAAWGMIWAAAGLAPLAPLPWLTTIGLLQEHRMGFSAAGLAVASAALGRLLWGGAARRKTGRVMRWTAAIAAITAVMGAIAVDRSRAAVWRDDRRLWGEVVGWSPDNMLARINLGAAYMEHDEYDRAEAEYRAIIALTPAYPRAYYNLGLLALRRGRTDDAVSAFERAAALDPGNASPRTHLGILALRSGDASRAEQEFEAALRLDPTQRDALNNLSAIYLERREWSKALSLVDEALARDPGFLEAAYNRGVALAGLGRRAEATVALTDVRRRLPPDAKFDQYRSGIDHLLGSVQP